MSTVPVVMISSTFYDLQQVRADLVTFLADDLGFRPLVSELHSFPVDPDATTVENCRRRVEREADVMVLLIGGRYGSKEAASLRSVTNIEYLAAKAKGIPIYTFIKTSVLGALPIWSRNPEADFSDAVDDVAVFKFISEIREAGRAWTHEFNLAQDVIVTLKSQFAYLFRKGHQWQRRLLDRGEIEVLKMLTGRALRTALEKPEPWEYRLFADLLTQEVARHRELRRHQELDIVTGSYQFVDLDTLDPWFQARMAELSGLVAAAGRLVNHDFQEAIGPPGQPGDLERIVYCARSLGLIYAEAINWSLSLRRTAGPDEVKELLQSTYAFSASLISSLEAMGPRLKETLDEMKKEIAQKGKSERQLTFSIDLPGVDDFSATMKRFWAKRRQGLEKGGSGP